MAFRFFVLKIREMHEEVALKAFSLTTKEHKGISQRAQSFVC